MGSDKAPKRAYKREEYVWFFKEADTDKDGFLSYEELAKALRHFSYHGSDWDMLVSKYIRKQNNIISPVHFNYFLFAIYYYHAL